MASFATIPDVIGLISARLSVVTRRFTGATSTNDGLPGIVPAPIAGSNIRALTSDGNWTTLNTTLVNPRAFTAWATATLYDVAGLFLYSGERLFHVVLPHTSTSIDSDILSGYLEEVTGTDLGATQWAGATIYHKHQVAVYNGQLLVSSIPHVSTNFAADCAAGRWKFVANSVISTTAVGAGNYSFTGHVVLKDQLLWSCITPHAVTTWDANKWLCLTQTFTGATASADGTPGPVPAPLAGQDNFVLSGNGQWRDLVALLTLLGYSGGGGGGGTVTTEPIYNINSSTIMGSGSGSVTLNSSHLKKVTPVDTTGGTQAINLPGAPAPGDFYTLLDGMNSWATNPVQIAAAKFQGVTDALNLDANGQMVTFVWINATIGWYLILRG